MNIWEGNKNLMYLFKKMLWSIEMLWKPLSTYSNKMILFVSRKIWRKTKFKLICKHRIRNVLCLIFSVYVYAFPKVYKKYELFKISSLLFMLLTLFWFMIKQEIRIISFWLYLRCATRLRFLFLLLLKKR